MDMQVSLEPVKCCREHRWTVRLFRLVPGKQKEDYHLGEVFKLKPDARQRARELVKQYKAAYNEVKR